MDDVFLPAGIRKLLEKGIRIPEEESSGAHAAGLKQAILFPFIILGRPVNFCDCLMGGGTNRRNHIEVGSPFIHFNDSPAGTRRRLFPAMRHAASCRISFHLSWRAG